jgi:hypothetical protein
MRGRRPSLASRLWLLTGLALLLATLEVPLVEVATGDDGLVHELSRLDDGLAEPIVDQASHPEQSPHYDASHVRFHHCDIFCNAQSRQHVQPGHNADLAVRSRALRGIETDGWNFASMVGLDSRAPRAPPLV